MFKLPTKKAWMDAGLNTIESGRSPMSSGFPATPQAKGSTPQPQPGKGFLASKLKEKLSKAREQIAQRKSNPESLTEPQIEQTIHKDKSESGSDDDFDPNFNVPREDGFTEKYNEQNEAQRRARQTMVMLKKNIKKREPATKNQMMNPQTIPILSYHYQQGPGMTLPTPNLRHMGSYDPGQQARKAVNEEKYNMKIDDPNSVLHIANYHQNKDFEQYAKVIVEDNKQYLKINAPDAFTFFRLHHELHEMNRKKARFLDMKNKFFDNKDPEEVIQYDENLDNFDAINSDKNYSSSGKKRETSDKKEHQYAERVADKLKDKGKKKDPKTWEKNFAYGLMGGIKDSKIKQG